MVEHICCEREGPHSTHGLKEISLCLTRECAFAHSLPASAVRFFCPVHQLGIIAYPKLRKRIATDTVGFSVASHQDLCETLVGEVAF